jgi:hypothetical protein
VGHPGASEIPPREGRALLEGFLVKSPEHAGLIRPALASEPRDDATIHRIVANFLA